MSSAGVKNQESRKTDKQKSVYFKKLHILGVFLFCFEFITQYAVLLILDVLAVSVQEIN